MRSDTPEGAEALAVYGSDFYAGRPALTVNRLGLGKAYYVASRNKAPFLADFIGRIVEDTGALRAIGSALPAGVTAQLRTDGESDYVFLMNFSGEAQTVELDGAAYADLLAGVPAASPVELETCGIRVLKRAHRRDS